MKNGRADEKRIRRAKVDNPRNALKLQESPRSMLSAMWISAVKSDARATTPQNDKRYDRMNV
jgi:hypothetical protein